jgi:hypothetical protein
MERVTRAVLAALVVAAMAGCDTRGQPLPKEQAVTLPPKYLSDERVRPPAEPLLPVQGVTVGESVWVLTGREHRLAARHLQPVDAVEGVRVHALAWDAPPYGRLFVQRVPGRWRELALVH